VDDRTAGTVKLCARTATAFYQEAHMDFITGALPNVMFIAGLIAMGIGLGIEFKIVEIKGELSKQGRMGAIGIGAALVLVSIYLYTRPPQTAGAPATAPGAQPSVVQANVGAAISVPQSAPTQPEAVVAATVPPTAVPPTATSIPPTATAVPPTATNVPPSPTAVPPTATAIPPTATAVPRVKVPDIRGQNTKDAKKTLEALGLQLGEQRERCEDIGAQDESQRKLKKDQIRCQSPAPGADAAPNTQVLYVLGSGDNRGDD
jgi:hypothetical protein